MNNLKKRCIFVSCLITSLLCLSNLYSALPDGIIQFSDGKQVRLHKMAMNGGYFYGNQLISSFVSYVREPNKDYCEFLINYAKRSISVTKIDTIKFVKVDREIKTSRGNFPRYVVDVSLKNGKMFQSYMAIARIFGKLSDGSKWIIDLEGNRELWPKIKRIIFM